MFCFLFFTHCKGSQLCQAPADCATLIASSRSHAWLWKFLKLELCPDTVEDVEGLHIPHLEEQTWILKPQKTVLRPANLGAWKSYFDLEEVRSAYSYWTSEHY